MSMPIAPQEALATDPAGARPGAAGPATARTRLPRHAALIVALVFAVALLKGLRMPNLWAATHMTFNYSQGFIRRGLFGQLLVLVAGDGVYQYNRLALLAAILLVGTAVLMARLVRRLLVADGGDLGLQAAVLAFAASPGLVFIVHEIGYLDYVGFIAMLLFIPWAAGSRRRYAIFYLALPISVLLALIHESMVVMFAPALLLAMVAHIIVQTRAEGAATRTVLAMSAHAALATGLAFATSTVVGLVGTREPAVIGRLQASIARQANFPLREDAFGALYRPVRDNLLSLMPWHWSHPAARTYLVTGLVVALPGLAFLIYYGVRLTGRLALGRGARLALATAFVGATLAPLSLNFVGWDSARWNAICFFDGFCGVATLRLFFPGAGAERRLGDSLTLSLGAVAVVCGLCSNYVDFLFDGYLVQWYPFIGQLDGALELLRGHFRFIPRM
jgi:hypothetical protein